MNTETIKIYFTAECGGNNLYLWEEPQFSSYMWYPGSLKTSFDSKEQLMKAISRADRKPCNAPIVIKTIKRIDIVEKEEELDI